MDIRWLRTGVVIVSAAALAVMTATGTGGLWRALLALWFMLTCPGLSLIGVFGLRDRLTETAVIAPLSLALVVLTSAALFYGGAWSPSREFGVLLGLCAGGLAWSYFTPRHDVKGET